MIRRLFTYKKIAIYSVIGAIIAIAFFAVRQPIVHYASDVLTFVKEYSGAHDDMLQALRQEIFSKPLTTNRAGDRANLSPVEVIRLTNAERADLNLDPLVRNTLLDQAATRKLQDMFDRQYFDHISPDGKGPGSLALAVGYSYVVVGENLAMGTFESDTALVDAWMNSPGHRANILNNRYTEIGVAVGHGTYNGERIWIAVQEFGKPSSACPTINAALRVKIEKDKEVVATMQKQITAEKSELAAMQHDTPDESAEYNARVSAYNELVSKYNEEIANLKTEIDTYNQQVKDFNSCANQ
jgi:uncharacterized protein YkwD